MYLLHPLLVVVPDELFDQVFDSITTETWRKRFFVRAEVFRDFFPDAGTTAKWTLL